MDDFQRPNDVERSRLAPLLNHSTHTEKAGASLPIDHSFRMCMIAADEGMFELLARFGHPFADGVRKPTQQRNRSFSITASKDEQRTVFLDPL